MMAVSALGQNQQSAGPITINDAPSVGVPGLATPYPSQIDLSKASLGTIEKVTVSVNNLVHPYAPDVGLLLVGPNGNAVVLMSDSGGNPNGSAALNPATLIFDDGASSACPVSSPLVSGATYKPTDNGHFSFPAPAPTSGYSATLGSAFAGSNPNGVWKLYVLDDTPGPPPSPKQSIDSWTLSIYSTPTIAVATNALYTTENAPVTLAVTVGSSSPAGNLTVSATCGNTGLVPNKNFSVSGSAPNFTLTITPASNAFGTNTVTVTITDDALPNNTANTSVALNVAHANQAPSFTSLKPTTVTTVAGLLTTNLGGIIATVTDPDVAPAVGSPTESYNHLSLSVSSSAPGVVAPSDVFFNINPFVSPTGTNRTIAIVPNGSATGTAVLTITVDDSADNGGAGKGLTSTTTLTVNVLPPGDNHPVVANASLINVNPSTSASSSITLPGGTISGLIGRVSVALNGLQNVVPGSTTLTLTAPNGQTVNLLPTGGPANPHNYAQVFFADSASGALPDYDNLTNTISLAPAANLSTLAGGPANGTWTLTVLNNATGAATILDGWVLNIYAAPTIAAIADQSAPEETSPSVKFTVGDIDGTVTNVTASFVSPSSNPAMAGIATSLSGNNATINFSGNPNSFGTNTVLVTVQDNNGFTATTTFKLALTFVDHAPTISFIDRQVISAGAVLGPLPFTVNDVDVFTPVSSLTVTATSDNQKLLPDSNVLLQQVAVGSYTVTVFPVGTGSGVANVTLRVSDGTLATTEVVEIDVQPAGYSLFAVPNPIAINGSSPASPYGSTNVVGGLLGKVEKVTVTLFGLSHPVPQNIQLLLLGPTGQTVLLMENAGGANAISNDTLVFADSGTALPSGTQIISGIYQPTAYPTVANLPAPAPAGTYGTSLSSYSGSNPNGNWVLFIADNGSSKGGILNLGWQLNIQTAPSIQTIKDQLTDENKALTLPVVVGDNQPAVNLSVTATPNDPTLIKPIGVSLSGSTATLTITPQPYRWGTNTITLTVSDGVNPPTTATFGIGVRAVPQAPLFVSFPGNQSIAAATPLPLQTFKIWGPQSNGISVSITSDNPALVPNISYSSAGTVPDTLGSGLPILDNIYTLTLIPAGVQTGTANLTVTATDGGGLKSSASFQLTVNANVAFLNGDSSPSNPISIPDGLFPLGQYVNGLATPYPSTNTVKGLGGVVSGVQVALLGFTHQYPSDVDVLLVAPDNSHAVILMAHAGNAGSAALSAVSGLRLTFDDTATAGPIPPDSQLTSGTYQPANYSGGAYGPSQFSGQPAPTSLPAPAPLAPSGGYKSVLNSTFAGLSPNGDWKLYILDDTYPDRGSVDGWILYLQTAPAIAPVAALTTSENTPASTTIAVGDASVSDLTKINLVVTSGGDAPAGAVGHVVSKIDVSKVGSDGTATITLTPVVNSPSAFVSTNATSQITVTATDPNGRVGTTTFGFVVQNVNQAPTAASYGLDSTLTTKASAVYVNEGAGTTKLYFNVADVDSVFGLTNITASSSDPTLVPNASANLAVDSGSAPTPVGGTLGMSGKVVVNVTPVAATAPGVGYGTNTITLTAKDQSGNSVSSTVTFGVVHVWQQPALFAGDGKTLLHNLSQPVAAATAGGASAVVPLVVGSVEASPKTLLVYATSDTSAVVPNNPANIIVGGSGANRTIQLIPIGTPPSSVTANITVWVTDLSGNANSTNSDTFVFREDPPSIVVQANTAPINISGNNTANLYPSTITVSGLVGQTFNVKVDLNGFTHNAPADLDVLLVQESADGSTNAVMLMSGAGGANPVSNLNLEFDDAGNPLPNDPSLSLVTGTNHPSSYTKNVLPAPAPTLTYQANLSSFGGRNPNGNWKLFVNNHGSGDVGVIASGWTLKLVVAPTIALVSPSTPPLGIVENQTGIATFALNDQFPANIAKLTPQVTSDNLALVPPRDVKFSLSGSTLTATIAPEPTQNGTANLTFSVLRSDGASASVNLQVVVSAVNVPPTISRIDSPQTMNENTTGVLQFLVSDPDTPLKLLNVKAESSDPALIASTSLQFAPYGTNQLFGLPGTNIPQTSILTLNMTPAAYQSGNATITITVTDNGPPTQNVISSNFVLQVLAVTYPPVISPIGSQTVAAGLPVTVPFSVSSPTAPIVNLVVSASSSDTSLVTVTGTSGPDSKGNASLTLQAASNTQGGSATITVTVTDTTTGNGKSASTTFKLAVLPSRTHSYANSQPIIIPQVGTGTPYPSTITVSGLAGPVYKLTVTVNHFTHHYPADVGMLLVGPDGRSIVLMNNAGGGSPATNATLIFDQSASGWIGGSSGGTALGVNPAPTLYQPKDWKGGSYSFPAPAPGSPYTNTTLTAFNGLSGASVNGTWSLYVWDQAAPDDGIIPDGWSLGITTLPVINGLTDISGKENTAIGESFTVSDDTPSTPSYQFVSVSSDNQSVVTNAGIVFNASGTNITVAVNPVPNAFGSAKISFTMINQDGQSVNASFHATFTQVYYAPVLSVIPDQTITVGSVASVPLSYSNQGLPQSALTVGFTSSNPALVPASNIKLVGSQLQIVPADTLTGTSKITVTVSNPNLQSASQTFALTVIQGFPPVFANSGQITINDNSPATPYPSAINVSGLAGNIAKLTVTLSGFWHTFPSDVSVLLVGPQGQKVVLMSRAGGSVPVNSTGPVRLTFDDASTTAVPQFAAITDGTYHATDYKSSDTFFNAGSPAPPTPPYSHTLSPFNGTSPNGTWLLYVQDDVAGDSGAIVGGWLLTITPSAPVVSPIAPQTTPENTPLTVPFTVGSPSTPASSLNVTASHSGDSPAGLVSNLTLSGTDTNRTLLITPGANLPSAATTANGASTITLTVTDGTITNSLSFPLTVTYVDQPPVISGLSDKTTFANAPLAVSFSVTDVDTAASNLVVGASIAPNLGTVTVAAKGNNQVLTFTPNGATGPAVVTVSASDGTATTTATFNLVVSQVPPTFGPIADESAYASQLVTVPLAVSYASTPLSALSFNGVSSNPSLVSKVTFGVVGTNEVATVNLASNQVGKASITIFVTDGVTPLSQSFNLTVSTPPTFAAIADQVGQPGWALTVPLSVSYPLTPSSGLGFSGFSSNTKLVSGITFATVGTNEVATVNIANNQVGTATVTIFVTDGVTPLSQAFHLDVSAQPTLTATLVGGVLKITFTGTPTLAYSMLSSTDLKTWTVVGTATADANGAAEFDVNASSGTGAVFYRALAK